MAAAGICAGALGYAVIWSYGEADAPLAVVSAAPPQETAPLAASRPQSAQEVPAHSDTDSRAEASAPVTVIPPPMAWEQQPASETASAPAAAPRLAETAVAPPDVKMEKPRAASAPKDFLAIASLVTPAIASPKTESPALVPSADRLQTASPPPASGAQEPPKREVAAAPPASRLVEKPVVAQPSAEPAPSPPLQSAAVVQPAIPPAPVAAASPEAASGLVAVTQSTDAGNPIMLSAPSQRPVMDARPRNFRAAAPVRSEPSAIAPPQASPGPEATVEPPMAATASPLAPSNDVALVPAAEKPEVLPAASFAPARAPDRSAKSSPRLAALPPAATTDRPRITIMRGRRPAVTQRAPAPQKQKVAALPSGTAAAPTATDAPPILVLRGARRAHYALASAPQGAPEPLLTVIRGARPRPVILHHYVQPNALILHIHH
jgi:hypothetical protein